MNIIDLNKQFYYQFHNRIYLSDPIYEFVQLDRPILVLVQVSAGLELSDINWNSFRIVCLRKLTKLSSQKRSQPLLCDIFSLDV